MEELEPWNMFTNDFVAEESDANALLDDADMGEYTQQDADIGEYEQQDAPIKDEPAEVAADDEELDNDDDENNDGGGEDEASLLVPEITIGDMGGDEDQSNGTNREDEPGEDDSTLFNFGLEPQTRSSAGERPKRSQLSVKEKKELEMLINYESAVIYICPACGSEFVTQDQWKKHLNGVHSFNTRQGLNFVRIDKLYHECMECYKRIAMHSMENLLKHKYTHLPYRCSKCKFCHRQYKYRQDLLVHLRTIHYDELIAAAKMSKESLGRNPDHSNNGQSLEIREIKENAVDIFENTFADDDDAIPVRNELMDDSVYDAEAEPSNNSFVLPAFLEDALSRESSHNSDPQSNGSGEGNEEQSLYEKQIQYICPDCGQEYGTQLQWQQHIVSAHNFGTREGLNFEEINSNQQAKCLECDKVIPVNIIHHLQQHKFTHLPHKSWLRCKLCFQAFVGRPDILRHLMQQHRLGSANSSVTGGGGNEDIDDADEADDSQDIWNCDDSTLTEEQRVASKKKRNEERDKFEKHIEYLCPTCGKEFRDKKLWRKHIVHVHKLTSLERLNFKNVSDREVMCLECGKVITNAYGIQNAQQHYYTHMPFKSFIRCRICSKTYTDRKGLVKHLRGKHFGRLRVYNPPMPGPQKPSLPARQQMQSPLQSQNQSNLLSRALQRPLRGAESPLTPPAAKRQRAVRHKEIVTRNNITYEIEYLDDDDNDEAVGVVNAANDDDNDDDVLLVPELSMGNSRGHDSSFNARDRCADCGSIFPNAEALRKHIREEHDFFERAQPYQHSNSNSAYVDADADLSNDDALLVPTGLSESVTKSTPLTSSQRAAECHFTYLCPACGVEHFTQIDWRRHINEVHNFDKRQYLNFRQLDKFRFQCTICQDVLAKSKLKTFQDHKFRHLPYKSYLKCKHCGTLYNHKPNMYGHLYVRHGIYVARANSNDDSTGESSYPTAKHFSKPPPPKAAHSRAMSGGYRSSNTPSSSSNAKHSSSVWQNKPPGLKTPEDVITFHNAVDHATITYFCPSCNENFDSHVFWRKHIVEEHNLNSREGLNFRQIDEHHYLCLQCYKRVTVTHTKGAIGQLQSHKFRHLPYKSFKCINCNGEFVRKQMFFKHLNRATNRCEEGTQNVVVVNAANVRDATPSSLANKSGSSSEHANKHANASARNGNNKPPIQIEDNADDPAGLYDTNGTNAALIVNQDAFVLVCPQCGQEFDSQRYWREHINIEHDLGKRERLRFKKMNPVLHKCLECNEYVNGRKLRDLQIHHFKHLPYGPYIQCKFCKTGYNHIRNMQDHLRQKHPNVVQKHDEYAKMEEMRLYEESSLLDSESLGESSVLNEADCDDEDNVDDDGHAPTLHNEIDEDEYLLG